MNGFRVLATNHTSFTVSDLDRSIAFFSEVLGFEMVNRAPRDPKLISSITGVPGAGFEVASSRREGGRVFSGCGSFHVETKEGGSANGYRIGADAVLRLDAR